MTRSLTNAAVVFARWLLIIGLIATLAVVFNAALRFETAGGRVLTVQTGSMIPAFRPGDAIIAERAAPASLQVGDIVSYPSLRDPAVTISHRIVAIDPAHRQLTTKGDALTITDPSISLSLVTGQVTAVAPGLGRLLVWLRSPLGLALAVYLPALGMIAAQARNLLRFYRTAGYRLYGR